jgi:ribonuclease HII
MIKKIKSKTPDLLIIDGNQFKKYKNFLHKCVIKGDAKYHSIAAASILAKTYRDNLMKKLSKKNPGYNWSKNKGYPTKEHKMKIIELGISKYHRKSFKLLDLQYNLKL